MAICGQAISGIILDCEASLGGIKEIAVARYGDVAGKIETDDDGVVTGVTSGNTAVKFEVFQFRKNTGSMETTASVSEATGLPFFTTNVNVVFGRMDAEKRLKLMTLALGQLCILVKDANNKVWLVGDDDYASMSASTATTGVAKGDANSYSITLTTESLEYPREVKEGVWESVVNYPETETPAGE